LEFEKVHVMVPKLLVVLVPLKEYVKERGKECEMG
jgi:hypothetical protein